MKKVTANIVDATIIAAGLTIAFWGMIACS